MTPNDTYAARYSADPADPSQAERMAAYSAGWEDRARTAASCAWIDLTDEDRDRALRTLPDMLDGFLKKWGWLHFAKAVEAICKEKNAAPATIRAERTDAASVADTLESYNRWRRGNADGLEQPHPALIGEAIDKAVAMLRAPGVAAAGPAPVVQPVALNAASLPGHINALAAAFGSLRRMAELLRIDVSYLSRLRSGEKTDPGDDVLWSLGLRRVVTYEALSASASSAAIPEGCTPADARVLREANHALAADFDLSKSAGGRGYVAWFFTNVIQRHDFNRYINEALAADFACTLARWLRDGTGRRATAAAPTAGDAGGAA